MKPFQLPAILLIVWAFLLPPNLPAQYNLTRTYTVEDGMPMTEVGRCLISRAGYLYLTTTTGHRLIFDGFAFREFSKGDVAQNPSDGQAIIEDRNGVWIMNGGNWYWYKEAEEMKIQVPSVKNWFLDEKEDCLVLENQEGMLQVFDPESRRFQPDSALSAQRAAHGRNLRYSQIAKFGKCWEVTAVPGQTGRVVYELDKKQGTRRRLSYFGKVQDFYPLSAEAQLANVFQGNSDLWQWKLYLYRDGRLAPLEGQDWKGRQRRFSNYLLSTAQGRVFLFGHPPPGIALADDEMEIWEVEPSGRVIFHARFLLPAVLSTSLPQPDAAGNFWLASQGGLVKVFPAFLGCFQSSPNMASGLHAISEDVQGNIWFGFYRHGFSKFDGVRIIPVAPSSIPFTHIMPGSWRDEEGWMYFFNESWYGFFKTNGRNWKGITGGGGDKKKLTGGYFHPVANGKKLAMGLYRNRGLGLMDYPFEPGKPIYYVDSTKGMELINVLTITEDRAQRIWFGRASQGLGVYDPKLDTAVTWLIDDKGGLGALSSLADARGNLWLGTSNGLAFLPNPEKFDYLHQNINGYARRLSLPETGGGIVTFMKEHRGFLFFGDNKGFGLLDLNSYYQNPENPRAHYFNTISHLPGGSSEQNAVFIDSKEHIWMGNDQGAIRLDMEQLGLDTSAIRLDTLFFLHGRNERSLATNGLLKLPRGQRNLSFHWSSSFDRQLTPNRWLSYRLILASGDTLQQSDYLLEPETYLGYIPPGNHRLEFTLYKDNQVMERRNIRLAIPKNLEETWWFWALVFGFLSLAGGSILWLVYTQKRQQQRYELATERLRREKEELQVQAITSSLNPHFLNNTLHLVQSRLRKDEIANQAIGKLAENIRAVFQKSREKKAFHSLLDEMKIVQNYLAIQNRRFDGRYEFILPTEDELMLHRHIMVPLMQVLIHAENGIERGLRNRRESTFLRIGLEDEGPDLKVTIEDDGIGYSNAKKKNLRGTRQGTKMLDSLHDIFNARNVRKIITSIEDNIYFDSQSGLSYGTRISILIPKQFNYELETHRSPGRGR
ncbi:MAG: histidine kinase [Phaeodactylibacter sp.]|nr:histidine kinase [Phaeodactylibacter sp.]